MHGAVVQRVRAAHDAQESGGLLEGFGSQPRHLEQRLAAFEIPVRGAVGHDVFRQCRPESRNVGQDVFRGGVDVHADPVDAALHHRGQTRLEFRLVDAVLVLSDADRLGVDFDQFRKGVDQAASDAHGSAHRHVVVGEFFAGRGRRRVDRCAVFAHHEDLDTLQSQPANQLFGLAACRAVADGECLGFILRGQHAEGLGGLGIVVLRRMRIDGRVVEQASLRVERHDFAPRAESGIEGDHALLAQRR